MKLYRTKEGALVEERGRYYRLNVKSWDTLINRDDLFQSLPGLIKRRRALGRNFQLKDSGLMAPIGSQEVWAAGVTYYRSREARMDESKEAGGSDFYSRVYMAKRPELFFKATPHRVIGHGQSVRIRKDSRWNVPEPELALLVSSSKKINGYTIGNDMSSRDIEGENPLYLPQAKIYNGSCALGPGILLYDKPLPDSTEIKMEILRLKKLVFQGKTALSQMKRSPESLVEYLYRENSFPSGCFLLTGTGIVPPERFTLKSGDEIRITIEPIGTLVNKVE